MEISFIILGKNEDQLSEELNFQVLNIKEPRKHYDVLTGKAYINNKLLIFMVNIRNLQIFGWRAYKPEKKHVVIALILIAVIAVGLWIWIPGRQSMSTVTSEAIAPLSV